MTEVAGEVPTASSATASPPSAYLQARSRSPPSSGARQGRHARWTEFEISGPAFVVTGTNEERDGEVGDRHAQQIAFYGSTPAYRGVLEHHGWGELQDELNRLSKQGKWEEMGELIDDDVLNTFAVVAEPSKIAPELQRRYGGVVDRLSFYAPYKSDPDTWLPVMEALKKI